MNTLAIAAILLASAALVAGCVNPYESGDEGIDCEPSTNQSQIDDGATSPLRCTSTGEETGSSGAESSSPR